MCSFCDPENGAGKNTHPQSDWSRVALFLFYLTNQTLQNASDVFSYNLIGRIRPACVPGVNREGEGTRSSSLPFSPPLIPAPPYYACYVAHVKRNPSERRQDDVKNQLHNNTARITQRVT